MVIDEGCITIMLEMRWDGRTKWDTGRDDGDMAALLRRTKWLYLRGRRIVLLAAVFESINQHGLRGQETCD